MNDERELRAEIDAAIRHLHSVHRAGRREHVELAAAVRALVEALVASGALAPGDYQRRRERLAAAMLDAHWDDREVLVDLPRDKYATPSPPIDCAALIPLCRARCCSFSVCLSSQDLDEGKLGWNWAQPYQMKKRPDGLCVYNDPVTRGCGVYEHRPASCRSYDCREDPRIWKDFANRIPAD